MKTLDPYTASIVASKDCNYSTYKANKWAPGINVSEVYKFISHFPLWSLYKEGKKYGQDPEKSKKAYLQIDKGDRDRLETTRKKYWDKPDYSETGLKQIATDMCEAITPSVIQECAAINATILGVIHELDQERTNGKTEEIRQDAEALCAGYEGDELMKINIAIYRLAQSLPESIWNEYDHNSMKELLDRILANLNGDRTAKPLPAEFLELWTSFMTNYGFDGQDQLFISCPRYNDHPELLLQKLKLNATATIEDPSVAAQDQLKKRQAAMAKTEATATKWSLWNYLGYSELSRVQQRNKILDHVMWMRNAPKLKLAQVCGLVRAEVLRCEEHLIEAGRLEEKGDIFHLDIREVDLALLEDKDMDLMELVRPRKVIYDRAIRSKACPILVDSRCRILKPDPPTFDNGTGAEPGTLVGAAVSPGVATGRVRIINNPAEQFKAGEVLCAVVTGPAWTPLFASANAIVLQIGGVLQHGTFFISFPLFMPTWGMLCCHTQMYSITACVAFLFLAALYLK